MEAGAWYVLVGEAEKPTIRVTPVLGVELIHTPTLGRASGPGIDIPGTDN